MLPFLFQAVASRLVLSLQQVSWSRCGLCHCSISFPSLPYSPGALSPLSSTLVQSCCANSQLGQHFLPSGSSQQQPAHYHTKHVPVSSPTSSQGPVLWRPLSRLPVSCLSSPGFGAWTYQFDEQVPSAGGGEDRAPCRGGGEGERWSSAKGDCSCCGHREWGQPSVWILARLPSCWVTVGVSPSLVPSSVPGPGRSDTHSTVNN